MEDQSDSWVELRVREWRDDKASHTCGIFLRGFEMATRVWREGKAWPSLSSSTHWDMELLLMWSLCSEEWE